MKSATFFSVCSLLLAAMLLWAVTLPQAQAQSGQERVNREAAHHAIMNDPRFCSYGYNPNCQSGGGEISDADQRHMAMAFSPSTGHWGSSSVTYPVRGSSGSEKALERAQNEAVAVYQCGQGGRVRDCTLGFSEEAFVMSAVIGLGADGRYQLFADKPRDDGISRLSRGLRINLGGLRRDKRETYQVLLDRCREVAQECRVVMRSWVGQGSPISVINTQDAYGAVYMDEADNSKVFAAASHATPQQAEASARALCQAGGGQQCSRWYGFANMCTAVAVGQARGESIHVGAEGMSRAQVAQSALQQCNDRGAGQCRVLLASCSMECDPGQMGCDLPRPHKN